MKRIVRLGAGCAIAVILTGLLGGAPLIAGDQCQDRQLCTHKTLSGAMLELSSDETKIAPRTTTTVTVKLTALVDLQKITITTAGEGVLEITQPTSLTVDFLARGESTKLEIPVRYTEVGVGAVTAFATATQAATLIPVQLKTSYNAFLRNDSSFAGMDALQNLKLRAVEKDYADQKLTAAQARTLVRTLTRLDGTTDTQPYEPRLIPVLPEWRTLPALPRPVRETTPRIASNWIDDGNENAFGGPGSDRNPSPSTGGIAGDVSIHVHGLIQWTDENGNLHPLYGMLVELRDDDTIGSELIADAITGFDGTYNFGPLNWDDGIGAGNPDIFIRLRTENGAVDVEDGCFLCGTYETDLPVHDEFPGGELVENFTCANFGTGPACSVLEGVTWAANFAEELNGGFLSSVRVDWPGDPASSNYNCTPQCRINVQPGDRWDWDTLHHEYGHKVQDDFDIEDNPGGPHNIGDCIGVVHNSKDEGIRMAWGEGWPTYFGTSGQLKRNLASKNIPRVGDLFYQDTEEQSLTYSIEANSNDLTGAADNNGLGEENEVAVTRVLFDLWDSLNDSRDAWSVSDQTLFNAVTAAEPHTLSAAWAAFRSGASTPTDESELAFGAIATDHAIAPQPLSPVNNLLLTAGGTTLTWRSNGCGSSSDPNSFQLRFFNGVTFAPILSINKGGATSHQLTQAEFNQLVAANHIIRWAVEGSNTNGPATGPYLGDNRLLRLNNPPICNAGGPYVVECQGEFTTIHLDGSGSSDPDGDVFTKTWSSTCPSPSFVNQNALVTDMTIHTTTCPTNCSVRLVLNDGFSEVECSTNVTVQDTTNPSVATLVATSGVVNGSCQYSMPFTATVNDTCCLPTSNSGYSATAQVTTNNATVGVPQITNVNRTTQGHAIVSGTVLVSDLTSCPATVRISFQATDCCGNSSVVATTIATVTDNIAPVITVCSATGGSVDANCIFDIPFSATFTDNCHIDAVAAQTAVAAQLLTANATLGVPVVNRVQTNGSRVDVTGTVRVSNLTSCPVRVRITFTPTDRCGNLGNPCIQEVEVIDDTPPVPVCPPPITVQHGNLLCDDAVLNWLNSTTATDNCDTDVTIVNDAPLCGFPYGSTTVVTWTATDNCNNSAQCQSTITVLPANRTVVDQKGSLLLYPKIELRWRQVGGAWTLIQDTFVTLTNDFPAAVDVQLYFIQGDPSTLANGGERAHPGCNKSDNIIHLTQDEPAYWSSATGLPKGVSPFGALDGGNPPGRPDPDGSADRVLRGYLLAWAVDNQDREIRWNHLSGDALILNYADSSGWEYRPWSYITRCVDHSLQPLDCTSFDANGTCCTAQVIPGRLDEDGFQYSLNPGLLLGDFYATNPPQGTPAGPSALSLRNAAGGVIQVVDTDTRLTFVPASADLRQETLGPKVTKAKFNVWNQNEVQFSTEEYCISCWDSRLVSRVTQIPNHFLRVNLQSDKGKFRVDGVAHAPCLAVNAAIVGASETLLSFPAGKKEIAGGTLIGQELESAQILYDVLRGGGEARNRSDATALTPDANGQTPLSRPAKDAPPQKP